VSRTSAVLPVTRSYTACTSVHLINKLLALPDHGFTSCLGTSIYLPLSKRGGELGDSAGALHGNKRVAANSRKTDTPMLRHCNELCELLLSAPQRQRRRLAPWLLAARELCSQQLAGRPADLPCSIQPHLLLSSKTEAGDREMLQALGITHLLNAAGKAGRTPVDLAGAGISYLELNGEDEEGYPMLAKHFEAASAFIRAAAAAGGRCLVHCVAGINRSGLLAVAELMMSERLEVLEALARAKRVRGLILWNESFQLQLVSLAEEHGLLGPMPQLSGTLGPPKAARRTAADALRVL